MFTRSPNVSEERFLEYGRARRLVDLYLVELAGLPAPRPNEISAVPIPWAPGSRVGKKHSGNVCLLVQTTGTAEPIRPDVRLQNLSVQRRVKCLIARPDGARESMTGVLVTCSSESEDLRRFFLDLFDRFLRSVGSSPSEQDVDRWIEQASRLFAELEAPPASEVRGLWGELLVIASVVNSGNLVRRWHDDAMDRFDFSAGSFALEVKTCRDDERVHQFSLKQLRPVSSIEVVVASVLVQTDPTGSSVIDLLAEIDTKVTDPALREKLHRIAFRLGARALSEGNQRFDRHIALRSIRWINAMEIPAVSERLADEILDVQLKVRCRDLLDSASREYVESRLA
jgi:hypothetical protein